MKRRILIISASTPDSWRKEQYDITNKNKKDYSEKHGYDFKFVQYNEITNKQSFFMKSKIILDEFDKYDWIMWLDSDAWIGNDKISLDDIIDTYGNNKDLIISQDCRIHSSKKYDNVKHWMRELVNTGAFLIRCSESGRQLMQKWNDIKNELSDAGKIFMRNISLNDQKYMCLMLMLYPDIYNRTCILMDIFFNNFSNLNSIKKFKSTFIWHATGSDINKLKKQKRYSEYIALFKMQYNVQQAESRKDNVVCTKTKNISIDDLFKHAFMITIDKKRLEREYAIFKDKIGYVPNAFQGVTENKNNIKNILESHIRIIRNAKDNGYPFAMIFEDDAYPCKDIKNLLQFSLSKIPDDSDVVLLGWTNIDMSHSNDYDFSKLYNRVHNEFCGAHAYIVFEKAYDKYIELAESGKYAADHFFSKFENTYSICYPLFIQYNLKDDNSIHGHVNYNFRGDNNYPPYMYDFK